MHLLILLSMVAVACADNLGYDYQPVAHAEQGPLFLPDSINEEAYQTQATLSAEPTVQQAQLIEEYQKEFYSYSAPEDEFDDNESTQNILGSLKKNLRVIFIRAPESKGFENAALALAKQAADQRTAIYVLSKQTDIGNLAQKLQSLRSQASTKPEVHFVKYRTAADAANAQREIQAQYNTLPGDTRSSNEGAAPVLNFASHAALKEAALPLGPSNQYLPAHPVPSQDYLPASLRRYRL